MNEKDPVVSIITVCYNCQDTIEKTIKSVIDQKYPQIQYILIDGGSTDGTLAIIETFKDRIDLLISEKDSGIYDAMNKGLKYATGDIIYFLNSGDLLFSSETIEKIVDEFRNNPEVNLIHGDMISYGETPDEYCSMHRKSLIIYFTQGLCHQTLFARKQVFDLIGCFDTQYSIFADRDWLFRCLFECNEKIRHVSFPICYSLAGGFSSRRDERFFLEKMYLLRKFFFNQRVMVLLIKNPWELFRVLGMIGYSLFNVISFTISRHGLRARRSFSD